MCEGKNVQCLSIRNEFCTDIRTDEQVDSYISPPINIVGRGYTYTEKNPSPSVNFDLCILFVHSILICLSLSAFLATYFDNTLNLSWTCLKYGTLSTHFKLLFNVHYEDTSTFLNIEILKKVFLAHKFWDLIFNISFIVQP